MSVPTPQTPAASKRGGSKLTLVVVGLLVVAAGGVYAYIRYGTEKPPPVDELQALKSYIENLARNQKLAAGYADADGDLVADAPASDPSKFLKVDEITFTAVGTDDPEKAQPLWKDFTAALEKATGKKVKYLASVSTIDEQLAAVREGRLHVTAFNTGQVPTAVNTAGFVPLFCPADAAGRYAYEMEILVRPDSPVQSPADLKGKTVGLVALSSNSGGKAPLVVLKDKFGLLPGRDYKYAIVGEHVRAVKELVRGKYDAVCVANDLLARAVSTGEVAADQYRSIYKSESFPPLCFGVPHNLPPELLAKVKQAFAGFSFAGTSVGERYLSQGKVKFAAVNYAADWKLVRDVDESLTRLLDAK